MERQAISVSSIYSAMLLIKHLGDSARSQRLKMEMEILFKWYGISILTGWNGKKPGISPKAVRLSRKFLIYPHVPLAFQWMLLLIGKDPKLKIFQCVVRE